MFGPIRLAPTLQTAARERIRSATMAPALRLAPAPGTLVDGYPLGRLRSAPRRGGSAGGEPVVSRRATRPRCLRRVELLAAVILLVLANSLPSHAQDARPRPRSDPPFYWGVDVGTATISSWVQGRFGKAGLPRVVLGGLAGGSLMYGGQRLIGTGLPGLRFVGLQTVAVGASVARNVGTGHAPWAELTFPVFPLYVQVRPVRPAGTAPVRVRASAVALGGLVHTAREFHRWPDWKESLIAGMPVFSLPTARLDGCAEYDQAGRCIQGVVGHHVFGAVAYATEPEHFTARNVLTHELGHTAQDVRDAVLHAVPASDFVLNSDPVGRVIARFLVIDVVLPLNILSRAAGPPTSDPGCRLLDSYYECETEAMMTRVP